MREFGRRHPVWSAVLVVAAAVLLWMIFANWPDWLIDLIGRKKIFVNAVFNGITLGGLYFLVASGFTLIFGLMHNVNLAHGSLYLLGGYIGYEIATLTGYWVLAFPAAFIFVAALGVVLQFVVFRRMEGQDLRQTLVTIGISIVAADVLLWIWGGDFYTIEAPSWLSGPMETIFVSTVKSSGEAVYIKYPMVRIVIFAASVAVGIAMWLLLNRTRVGMLIRAGVDDRDMLSASGARIQLVFVGVFAFGAGLAGMAGVVGGTFQSMAPGEDVKFLLASLVVVIVGGMGSIPGAALGALIIGLAEQLGSVYFPTYYAVLTFLIMVVVLAFRPQGLMGEGVMALAEDRAATGPGTDAPTWAERIPAAYWVLALVLLIMPAVAGDFILFQIFGWTFILGIIALSLMFLAGYGGMVSLVQMTLAGVAGYMVAIFGTSAISAISLGWPWYVSIPLALVIAVLFGTLTGWLAVRTEGIYTIMITLAIAAAFFYFTNQNYTIFNGFSGFNSVLPPDLFGVDWRGPVAFYYLTLFWAVLAFMAVLYVSRAPFGLALQGVRDNPRRMAALGFNVTAHRVAAYSFAAVLAGIGGILLTWQSAQISPGTAGVGPVIDVLVIAVIGGLRHPIGPFIGAFIYVLLKTFALDALIAIGLSGERFQLLIGIGFLAIVFWSPDGILGLWEKLRAARGRDPLLDRGGDTP